MLKRIDMLETNHKRDEHDLWNAVADGLRDAKRIAELEDRIERLEFFGQTYSEQD